MLGRKELVAGMLAWTLGMATTGLLALGISKVQDRRPCEVAPHAAAASREPAPRAPTA